MSKAELPAVLRDVQTLFHRGTLHGLTDEQLLARFRSEPAPGAELAFAGLVARHGSLVLGVCRRALRDPNDVADAFQATFLVLVRKAETVQARDSLGRWLYGVSRRVAIRARRTAAKRATREVDAVESLAVATSHSLPDDLAAILDEEIDKLPARYRDVVVLCDLQDQTQDEAARQLGCAVGTVKSRLSRGRDKLRARLIRRGVAPAAGVTAGVLSSEILAAEVPAALAEATVKAAIGFAAGPLGAAGIVSARVGDLAQGVIRTMLLTRVQLTLSAMTTLLALATGIGVMAMQDTPRSAEPGSQPNLASSPGRSPESPAEAADKTTAEAETPKEQENVEEERLDRLDALQIDIELLSIELNSVKSRLTRTIQSHSSLVSFEEDTRFGDQSSAEPLDGAALEKRREAILVQKQQSENRINELRMAYLSKSREMRQKQRELDALLKRQADQTGQSYEPPSTTQRLAPFSGVGQRPTTTEQRLTEIERRLDEVIKLLGEAKAR